MNHLCAEWDVVSELGTEWGAVVLGWAAEVAEIVETGNFILKTEKLFGGFLVFLFFVSA
jgi:hypothetical protein